MRWPLLSLAAALAACDAPSPGEEAMREIEVSMRVQTSMVQRGAGLHEIFGDCSSNCSGHRAGYLWALDQSELTDESSCDPAAGEAFAHGCRMGMRAASFE